VRIQQLAHVSGAAFLPLYRQESACIHIQQLVPAAMLQPHKACSWNSNLHAALDGQLERHFSLRAALGCLSVRFGTHVRTHSDVTPEVVVKVIIISSFDRDPLILLQICVQIFQTSL